jgi:hypothetical protein
MVMALLLELVTLSKQKCGQLAKWVNMQHVLLRDLQAMHKGDNMAKHFPTFLPFKQHNIRK